MALGGEIEGGGHTFKCRLDGNGKWKGGAGQGKGWEDERKDFVDGKE